MLNGMYKNDAVGRMGFGIFSLSQPATIGLTCINNIIKNTGYSAISFAGDNNLIQNNFIDSCCLYVDDGGGIYLVNNFTASGIPVVNQNNQVLYNIVDHSLGAGLGADKRYNYAHSYYSDDNSNHVRFIGNTGVNSGYSGIFTHNANNNIIQNNVFYNNYDNQMYYQDDGVGGYIFSNDVQGNNLFSLDGSKYMLYLASADNNFSTFFSVCNNNYYCSPFGESKLSYTNWFSHPTTFYDFTGWQNTYHQDLSTSKTPVSVTDVNNVFFQYNATNTPVKVILDGTYIELDHTPHNTGSIIIQPFSSVILIKISSTIPKKKKYNPFRGKFKN